MKVAIFGAGSTGCYIGGVFALAGIETTLICRERIKSTIEQAQGMTLTDYEGRNDKVMPSAMITELTDEQFDLVLVTLKCHQLSSISETLQKLAKQGTKLVFMQNGLGSLDALRGSLPEHLILQGITPFNVLSKDSAVFHRGTEGNLAFQRSPETEKLKQALRGIGLDCDLYDDMNPVIYGKLLLNLNNAINAIADLPLKAELEDRRYRKVLAAAMQEWLSVCQAQGVELQQYTAVKPAQVPKILRLPNLFFKILASKMLAIDPEARSSMWEDIQASRKTEVEFLNGAVASLGQQQGVPTPVNAGITLLIQQLENGQRLDQGALFDLL